MSPAIDLKRGDSFKRRFRVENDDGTAKPITGWGITAQARLLDGTLVADMQVSGRADAQGEFDLSATDTRTWPIADVQVDVRYVDAAGTAVSTEVLTVRVQRGVTEPAA